MLRDVRDPDLRSLFASERPVAVVYPAFSVNCYGVIRSLGERGIPVLALDEQDNPNFASRYCQGLICPSPKTEPDRFAAFLAELGDRFHTRPVLYMMEDLYVYLAHRYRALLEPRYRFSFLTEQALFDCLDKRRTFEVAAREGVPLPPTWYPKDMAELAAMKGEWRYPVILKPVVARFDFRGGRVTKICEFPTRYQGKAVQAEDYEELKRHFLAIQAMDIEVCVQELIPGVQEELFGATLYADAHSEVLGICCRTKIRQTPWDFGTMTLGRAAAVPEIVDYARRLIKAVGFHGICGMEFKRDPRDGTYRFLEINPRGELWMNLATRCGVNLPYLKYQDLIGEPVRAVQTDFSRRLLDLRDDFSLYYMKYRHDVGAEHHVSFWQWLRSIARRDVDEVIFNWRDPKPGLLRFQDYAGRVIGARLKRGRPGPQQPAAVPPA